MTDDQVGAITFLVCMAIMKFCRARSLDAELVICPVCDAECYQGENAKSFASASTAVHRAVMNFGVLKVASRTTIVSSSTF